MNRREFIKLGGSATVFFLIGCNVNVDIDPELPEDDVLKIPDYYFQDDYLKNKVSRVNYLLSQADCDAFIFITDTHWEYNTHNSPSLIAYINKHTSIKRVFVGGDIGNVFGKDSYDCISALRNSWDGEIHCVVGNHEYLGDVISTEKEIPVIVTTCDKYLKLGGEQMRESRPAGSIEEQAFDVFVINKKTNTINAVRIGGLAYDGIGDDKGISVEERIIKY